VVIEDVLMIATWGEKKKVLFTKKMSVDFVNPRTPSFQKGPKKKERNLPLPPVFFEMGRREGVKSSCDILNNAEVPRSYAEGNGYWEVRKVVGCREERVVVSNGCFRKGKNGNDSRRV